MKVGKTKLLAIAVALAVVVSAFALVLAVDPLAKKNGHGDESSGDSDGGHDGSGDGSDCNWKGSDHDCGKGECCTCGHHEPCPGPAPGPEPEPCPEPDPSEPGTIISALAAI